MCICTCICVYVHVYVYMYMYLYNYVYMYFNAVTRYSGTSLILPRSPKYTWVVKKNGMLPESYPSARKYPQIMKLDTFVISSQSYTYWYVHPLVCYSSYWVLGVETSRISSFPNSTGSKSRPHLLFLFDWFNGDFISICHGDDWMVIAWHFQWHSWEHGS